MSDATKWLDRVRGLLAKAESTTHPAEAEALREKAMTLIAKYGIDEAMLGRDDPRLRRVGDVTIEAHAPFAQEKALLWNAVTRPLGVRTVQRTEWREGGARRASRADRQVLFLHAFGRAGDLERAQLLYTSLLMQQATEFAKVDPVSWTGFGQDKAAYRRSWLAAYAVRVRQRLEDLVSSAVRAAGQGAELVLVTRDEEITDAVREKYPNTRTRKRQLSGAGWEAGAEAGDRARLGEDAQVGPVARGALS